MLRSSDRRVKLASIFLAATMLASPAFASDGDSNTDAAPIATSDETEGGQPVVVIGQRQKYLQQRIDTGTKTDTRLQDIPQAITIVTADQMNDQGMAGLQDVVRTVPGASLNTGEGHRDQILLRGQTTTADFFVNGMRDDVQYLRGLYNLERVEVLKGPNAMIFGRGGGGGIVNRVTKKADGVRQAGAHAGVDQYGSIVSAIDVGAPLAGGVNARLNAAYDRIESFRDLVDGNRLAVNPTLGTPLGGGELHASYEYARDRRTTDRGQPDQNGGLYEGPRADFFGDEAINKTRLDAHIFDLGYSRALGPVQWRAKGRFADYDKAYSNGNPATSVQADGTVGMEAYRATMTRENWLLQNDFIANAMTGLIEHQLLFGADLAFQSGNATRQQGWFDTMGGARRIYVPVESASSLPTVTFRDDPARRITDGNTEAQTLGIYVQDQIQLSRQVELLAGLRYDRFELDYRDNISGAELGRVDHAWSPRLGLVLKPRDDVSFYGSWSRSFLPQSGDQFSSLSATLETLEPEKFENLELGAKWTIDDRIMATAAIYQLDRTNTRSVDPLTLETVLTGEQRSKGIELGLTGRATEKLSLAIGAAFQEARITEDTSAAPAGTDVPHIPAFQASLWARYDLSDRIGLGFGATHMGKRFASTSNTVELPAYERFDAAAFIGLTKALEMQINVENLFDVRYGAASYGDHNIQPGAPRAVRASLNFKL